MADRFPSSPAFFAMRNSLDYIASGKAYGCTCAICGRKIAAPITMQKCVVWCLYCGMERGFVRMVEVPPGYNLFPFGATAQEAMADA